MSGTGDMTWREVATLMRNSLYETADRLSAALRQLDELRTKMEELTMRLMEIDTEVVNSVLPAEDRFVTKTGKVLTDEDIEALADEAERGYDVSSFTELAARETVLQRQWETRESNGEGEQVDLDSWRAERMRKALRTMQATFADENTPVSIEIGPNQYRSYTIRELKHLLNEEAG